MSEKLRLRKPTLVFISGLSATGKTTATLAAERYFKSLNLNVKRPVVNTTRDQRPHEEEGKDYYFWGHREFMQRMKPQIDKKPGDYDYDFIGNSWYWSRYEDTVPNPGGLSILPIALSVCSGMREKYNKKYPKVQVATLSFRISDKNLVSWRNRMETERPSRNWRDEHSLQEIHCKQCSCTCLEPDWNIETDTEQFLLILSQIVLAKV